MKIACATYSYVAAPPGHDPEWASLSVEEDAGAAKTDVLEFVDAVLDRLGGGLLDGLEFWFAHVPARKLTPVLASAVRRRLRARGLACAACGGSVGNPATDPEETATWFQVAWMLHAPLIAGNVMPEALQELARECARCRVRVAYENHPETEAGEILERIKGGNEWIGVALDTGSLAQHGGDPVQAIRQLGKSVIHVHVRDVPSVGSKLSVPIGTGIVDVRGVVRELVRTGYQGWASIEIPLEGDDPSAAILDAAQMIRRLCDR